MTVSYRHNANRILLTKDGATVFDTNLKTFGLVNSSKITVTGQSVAFPDLVKDNAYYWKGVHVAPSSNTETAASYITAPGQETSLADILLGTVPAGTDYLDVKATITRTVNPTAMLGDTLPPVVPTGKAIRLIGGSCLLEENASLTRGFAIVLSGTNVYLRRYQSVPAPTFKDTLDWAAGNSASTSNKYTYGTVRGTPVYSIATYGPTTLNPTPAFQFQRGQGSQLSLADSTNFASTYSVDMEITPGFFNTAPSPTPPAGLAAVFAAFRYSSVSGTSFTFSSVPFVSPDATRQILVAISAASAAASISSVTIGGVSATKIVESASTNVASIWMANVPTGNSGSIVVVTGGTCPQLAVTAVALYHLASTTAHDTKTIGFSGGGTGSVSLTTVNPGFAIAVNSIPDPGGAGGSAMTGMQKMFEHFADAGGNGMNMDYGFQPTDGTTLTIAESSIFTNIPLAAASFG